MWIAKHMRFAHLDGLAIGHYGFVQLVLVRLLARLVGTTLAAAKVVNIIATVIAGVCAFATVRTLTSRVSWAIVAAIAFMLFPVVYYEAQSEFGDPLALGFYAVGLAILMRGRPDAARLIAAGLVIGVAGCVRVHFQTFGWATALVVFGLEASLPNSTLLHSLKRTSLFAAAVLVGQLPMFVINWRVHGALSAPSTSGFLGSALFGFDAYDVPATHLLYPMSDVLRDHKLELVSMIADRLLDIPPALAVLMLIGGAGVVAARKPHAAAIWLLAAGYYVGFIAPAWGITYRLLIPFAFLAIVSATLALNELTDRRHPRLRAALVTTCLLAAVINIRAHKGWLRAERGGVDNHWSDNSAIERLLRQHGMRDARQVFAVDWWTHPVSDPDFQPYYNFGFRNLLDPEFAAERPNPIAYVDDAPQFIRFLAARGVSYLVLTPSSPFPALDELCERDTLPEGFAQIGRINGQVVYAKDD
jgi:hypothetical protein